MEIKKIKKDKKKKRLNLLGGMVKLPSFTESSISSSTVEKRGSLVALNAPRVKRGGT